MSEEQIQKQGQPRRTGRNSVLSDKSATVYSKRTKDLFFQLD